MKRNVSAGTRKKAKELRRSLTPAETMLWSRLRGKSLQGMHIRKQHPIGPYIADFYIAKYKLVIELDGEPHDFRYEKDLIRDKYMKDKGYKVLRIRNNDVMNNVEGVVEYIRLVCLETEQPPSVSPPELRGESR